MASLFVAGYMGIGLIAGYIMMKIADKKIREGHEGSEGVEKQAGNLIDIIGYRNFLIFVYIMFALVWLPASLYVIIKNRLIKP